MSQLFRILSLLSLQLIVAPTGSAQNVDCRTFDAQPGLCPFGGLCQCTLGASCSAGAEYGPPSYPFSRSLRRADGACAGECLQVVPGQCPGPASCLASSGPCIPPAPCVPPTRNESARSVLLTLTHQGFAGHAGALVYVPTTFVPSDAQLSIVVFIHGFHNCVANCVLPEINACNCSAGGGYGTNQAYGLLDAFEAAAQASAARGDVGAASVAQSIFIAAEVAYDQASSDPGNWSSPGLFAAFIADVLAAPALAPLAGSPRVVTDVTRVRVFSHSGGYAVAAALATPALNGELAAVLEVGLLDSLYGSEASFDAFVRAALARRSLGPAANETRFLSVYTDTGGTEANNRAMASRVAGWLAVANSSELMLDDDTPGTALPPAAVARIPVIFKRSSLSHDDTCRHFFSLFLSGIAYAPDATTFDATAAAVTTPIDL